MKLLRNIFRAVRPRQWLKNVLLLAGLYFPDTTTGRPLALDQGEVGRALGGFIVFCMLSGAVYLLNDLIDAPRDRLHPRKRLRPIASGELKPAVAVAVMILFAGGALFFAHQLSLAFLLCAAAYFGMNIAYTLVLKEVFLIDVMIISMGFILRAVSGVIVLRTSGRFVELTPWFVICVLFLSLFLAFCKRRTELLTLDDDAASHRAVLGEYSPALLDLGIGVCATASIIAYALYATGHARTWMMLTTLPFVLFGIFRYLHLVYTHHLGDAPEEALLSDKALLGCIAMWGMALFLVFYPGWQ